MKTEWFRLKSRIKGASLIAMRTIRVTGNHGSSPTGIWFLRRVSVQERIFSRLVIVDAGYSILLHEVKCHAIVPIRKDR